MEMTNEEIFRDYKLSKNKQRQLQILADINGCSVAQIKTAIQEYGDKMLQEGKDGEIENMLKKIQSKRGPKSKAEKEQAAKEGQIKSAEHGSRLPNSVRDALLKRVEFLKAFVDVKEAEILTAKNDIKEIREYLQNTERE